MLACEGVKTKPKQHNLTDEQKGQLREREATERAAAESALVKLYTEVWLPRIEESVLCIESVAVGGRPPQTTTKEMVIDKKTVKVAAVHERIMELLTIMQRRVHETVKPAKIVELFKLGAGTPPKTGIKAADVVGGFYSFLGFPRLATSDAIRRGIAAGVQDRFFGYVGGAPEIGLDGKYQVPPERVRFGAAVAEDEIDLDSGFLMMPSAIPQPASVPNTPPVPGVGPGPTSAGSGPTPPGPGPIPTSPGPTSVPSTPETQKTVELAFTANRNQLYTAWSAMANLADMAGKVNVTVRAESNEGFDRGKLQNGVIEPLREADLIE
jgi:hypothetical protein